MAYLHFRVLDNGLNEIVNQASAIHICSSMPTDFASVAGVSLGYRNSPSFAAPVDATPNGRKIVLSAFSDGAVTANGTATHYAIVDLTNNRLLAANTLSPSQVVVASTAFSMSSFAIRLPGV